VLLKNIVFFTENIAIFFNFFISFEFKVRCKLMLEFKTARLKKLSLLMLICSVFSCVPRHKLILLQEDPNEPVKSFQAKEQAYQLKPNDVIDVNIFSLTPGQFDILAGAGGSNSSEEKSASINTFVIDAEGRVELPAIGEVPVAGMTIKEAQNRIADLLEDYLRSPLVRITLQTPFEFTILGEVNAPGRYTLIGQEEVSIIEALGEARDFTRFADRENVRLVRKNEEGYTEIYEINLLKDDALTNEFYYLKSEDVLVVDPLKAQAAQENQLFLFSTLVSVFTSITFIYFNLSRLN
jgi:polysaccharide export outer membrane protein